MMITETRPLKAELNLMTWVQTIFAALTSLDDEIVLSIRRVTFRAMHPNGNINRWQRLHVGAEAGENQGDS